MVMFWREGWEETKTEKASHGSFLFSFVFIPHPTKRKANKRESARRRETPSSLGPLRVSHGLFFLCRDTRPPFLSAWDEMLSVA